VKGLTVGFPRVTTTLQPLKHQVRGAQPTAGGQDLAASRDVPIPLALREISADDFARTLDPPFRIEGNLQQLS